IRSRQRRRRLGKRFAAEAAVSSGDEERSDRIDSLDHAVKRLSPPLRHVVLLHYVEEFSIEEVADILGIPRGTVKSRLHNARKQLRALIEEESNAQTER
ncbi:RNA polymerase sigma factor, partial [Planctomycetota bacterium]